MPVVSFAARTPKTLSAYSEFRFPASQQSTFDSGASALLRTRSEPGIVMDKRETENDLSVLSREDDDHQNPHSSGQPVDSFDPNVMKE